MKRLVLRDAWRRPEGRVLRALRAGGPLVPAALLSAATALVGLVPVAAGVALAGLLAVAGILRAVLAPRRLPVVGGAARDNRRVPSRPSVTPSFDGDRR